MKNIVTIFLIFGFFQCLSQTCEPLNNKHYVVSKGDTLCGDIWKNLKKVNGEFIQYQVVYFNDEIRSMRNINGQIKEGKPFGTWNYNHEHDSIINTFCYPHWTEKTITYKNDTVVVRHGFSGEKLRTYYMNDSSEVVHISNFSKEEVYLKCTNTSNFIWSENGTITEAVVTDEYLDYVIFMLENETDLFEIKRNLEKIKTAPNTK